jgi:hypothetical protein
MKQFLVASDNGIQQFPWVQDAIDQGPASVHDLYQHSRLFSLSVTERPAASALHQSGLVLALRGIHPFRQNDVVCSGTVS